MTETIGAQQTECQKQSSGGRGNLVVNSIKTAERSDKKEIQSGENIVYNATFTTLFGCYMVGAT